MIGLWYIGAGDWWITSYDFDTYFEYSIFVEYVGLWCLYEPEIDFWQLFDPNYMAIDWKWAQK